MNLNANSEQKAQLAVAVKQLHILYTEPEEAYQNIAQLASTLCSTQAAAIIFADGSSGWVKAGTGINFTGVDDFDNLLLRTPVNNPLLIQTRQDTAWEKHPLYTRQGFHFYAGVALTNSEGIIAGHLAVLDTRPRELTQQQIEGLQLAGRQVQLLLNSRVVKAEAHALEIHQDQIREIFYNAVNAVIITNDENTVLHWNPKAETTFGWTAHEVAGKKFDELCLTAAYRQTYNHAKSEKGNDIEAIAMHKNGSVFEVNIGLSSFTTGQQTYHIAFISDITQHKQITSKLDKQKEFYENILNKLPTDIAVFDANHRYLFVNPGAISNEEYRKFIVGKDDYEYAAYRGRDKSVADYRRAQFLQIKDDGKEIRWEDSLPNPEGKTITHLRRLFPVHDENGELTMVIGFGMDITERKIMEVKQAQLVKQLSAQNAQLIDFCNIVSHNLRGPLVNMSMLVQFIEETEDAEEQRFLISKLQPVLDNLHTTFNELVESIQIKQDLEVQSEKLNFQDCVQRTIEGLKTEIDKTCATIETDFSEASTVIYPPKYLVSIFHNLIGNALKYHSPNRKPVIKIVTKKENDRIILSVSDNGLGLDIQKHKDNLFKIGKVFHRHPNAKGFGLFMTKTQVEAMDGDIWVESAPNEGATFFVEFKKQNL